MGGGGGLKQAGGGLQSGGGGGGRCPSSHERRRASTTRHSTSGCVHICNQSRSALDPQEDPDEDEDADPDPAADATDAPVRHSKPRASRGPNNCSSKRIVTLRSYSCGGPENTAAHRPKRQPEAQTSASAP